MSFHIDLLRDVPQVTGGVQSQKSILDGNLVEIRSFFVSEEGVWNPYFVPAVLPQPHVVDLVMDCVED